MDVEQLVIPLGATGASGHEEVGLKEPPNPTAPSMKAFDASPPRTHSVKYKGKGTHRSLSSSKITSLGAYSEF